MTRSQAAEGTVAGLLLALASLASPWGSMPQQAEAQSVTEAQAANTVPFPVTISPLFPVAAHFEPLRDSARSVRSVGTSAAAESAPRAFLKSAPWQPPLASALLPGAGQFALGQRRGWVYAALEVAGWIAWADRRGQGNDFRTRYRDFAWDRARIQSGARVDTDFGYYETLTKWTRSGVFDGDAGTAGIQPETDPATFNGSIWALASGLFLPPGESVPVDDPRYLRAIDYYQDRAFGTPLLWDWGGTGSAQDDYADLIRTSDEGFRQATNVLGAIIANHVVSAIDAFVSARGIVTPEASRIEAIPGSAGTRWSFTASWAVSR